MQHAIDPRIDCVFKALLGAEENRNLLLHFLNAILVQDLVEPLVWVDILNPYNEKEFLSDKLSIVDVKAKDSQQRLYQIEVQLSSYGYLAERILYNWSDLYSQQLKSGQNYNELEPTYSIWLLAENLLINDNEYLHQYKMRDQHGQTINAHGGIWILELNKFNVSLIETEAQRWLKFFKDGEQLNDTALPDWMSTLEMKQAMTTLTRFSEKEREYFQYQARQEYLREQRTKEFERQKIQFELEKATLNLEHTHKELEQTSQELEQTSQELEQTSQELEQTAQELEQTAQELEQTAQELEQTAQELEQTAQELEQANQVLEETNDKLKQSSRELEKERLEKEIAKQAKEAALAEKETAIADKIAAKQREEAALAEIEQLKAMLANKSN